MSDEQMKEIKDFIQKEIWLAALALGILIGLVGAAVITILFVLTA